MKTKYRENMKTMKLLLAVAALGVLLASCGNKGERTVKIAYLPITHALPALKAAQDKAGEGVKVELVKFGSWQELLDALNSGRVDGASVLIELAMKSKQEGVGIKAVALGHHDGNAVIVSNKIENVVDLKGKTFAIPHRQSSHNILFRETIERGGLAREDVNVVELPPTEMPSALASGQIDGYCVAEPFGAMAVSLGVGRELYSSSELWENSLCCALVLTDEFIEKRGEEAKAFVEAYNKAGNELHASEDESLATAKKYFKQNPDVLRLSLKWISFDNLGITPEQYEELVAKVKKYGISDNSPAYDEFVKEL